MEITVYSCGDSRDIATWSNVPYLFCRALERKGIKVNRVNIEPHKFINRWYNRISYCLFQKILKSRSCPTYARSRWHRKRIERILRHIDRQFPNSDLNLFLSYSFINRQSSKPSVLWCDWPDRTVIERIGREPMPYEKKWLNYEAQSIKDADGVYTMFPVCKKEMEGMYSREIRYLGSNVVNTVLEEETFDDSSIKRHYLSNKILFVGGIKYLSSARMLINEIAKVRESGVDAEVEIIGLTAEQLSSETKSWIHCHGYLRKDCPEQRELYYRLLKSAKLIVNSTAGWAGYSSIIEAMYYGCPVVVAPFDDFVEEMGDQLDFGYFLTYDQSLYNLIEKIFRLEVQDYNAMSRSAHYRVKAYTWDNYVDLFLSDLETSLNKV